MSDTRPEHSDSPRPADRVNEEIRALWLTHAGSLPATRRHEYEALLAEWAAAVRAEIVEAA
ncbi:hypothetical protein [Streptomyces tsukubensis]|uniref:Uncharacterized protein n=1 Tax=Streptomyces tsukubensis TaxID=83656 RepID=A0A1V4ACX8_9ACTN|nr:hypothetical protein [Streptomyces tsukubensis]OON81339.1 hypothetical protein B1H18_08315 [Streptomyces tsukubensis]QFR95543.1 hypothetical protein GBW32_24120 [Streptomyces tsukubensis]